MPFARRRLLASFLVMASTAAPALASRRALAAAAQLAPAPPPPAPAGSQPAPAPVAPAPAPLVEDWRARYETARERLIAGKFADAAALFAALAETAPDATAAGVARELSALATRWSRGGYVLRSQVQEAEIAHAAAAVKPDRRATDELAVLYTGAVLYGIFSGVVLDVHTEPKSSAGFILPPLLFAGASAGLVAALDLNLGLRYGVPQSIVSGLFIGLEQGIAWTVWRQASADYDDEWSEEAVATVFWGAATAGALAGGIYGTLHGTTPGRASFMGSAALWTGLVAGMTAGAIARDTNKSDDYAMLTAAVALNLGAVAGVVLGNIESPSIARVRFIDLGAIAGGLVFGGLYLALADDNVNNGRTVMAVTATGIAAGLGAAWYLTRDMEPDHPRGRDDAAPAARTATITPIVGPAPSGQGMVLGLAGVI